MRQLPEILKEASDRWSISLLPPFQPLSYNYVAPATRSDGAAVVLKAGVPNQEFLNEIEALRNFDGEGMVQLLKADGDAGIMLLERIVPGELLQSVQNDDLATSVFVRVMQRLKKSLPNSHPFPRVADWALGFVRLRDQCGGGTGPFPERVIDRAEKLMSELIGSMSDPILLHGDLHHWNILSGEREPWLALDPQGVIGEQEYEVGAWLRNPFPQILKISKPKQLIARRVDRVVEELGFDRGRIIGWAYSQAVLAGVWSFEEGAEDINGWLDWANKIAALL